MVVFLAATSLHAPVTPLLRMIATRMIRLCCRSRVGKMVLWAYMLGCAGPALMAACAMTYKDPFVLPMGTSERKQAKSAKLALAQVNSQR